MRWGKRQAGPQANAVSSPPLAWSDVPWLLAAALATAGPHGLYQPLWLTLLAATVMLWRLWIWWRHLPLPPRWVVPLLALAGLAGIGLEYRTLFGRDPGVGLLLLFLPLKLMELKQQRDGVVVLMLGYFLLLTHYFHSQSIPTGLWMLAAMIIVTMAMIRLHGGQGASPRQILRLAVTLTLQAVPFMLALYLLFPRVAGPLWGLPRDAHAGLTGLSDSMAPGSLSQLIQNGEIAFRVEFSGPMPPRQLLYWRGPVLDLYDGARWRPRFLPDKRPPTLGDKERRVDYTITLEPSNQRWLLPLEAPARIPEGTELTNDLQVLARQPVTTRTRLTFQAALEHRHNLSERKDILQRSLQLPPERNPRTLALARQWQQETPQAEALVQRALALFRAESFFYTLRPPLLGPDAMDDFLFETRRGFCEHYASAFVVLMRAAGVPARVVTGYQGGEVNPVDGFLTVRHSDAHAWAEVWIEDKGWLRVDPTAAISPARVESGIAAALPEGEPLPALVRTRLDWLVALRYRWEAANNAWNQWVLGYDPQRQKEVLQRLGMPDPDWRSMAAVLATLCGAMLLILTFFSLRRRSRRSREEILWQRLTTRLGRRMPALQREPWEGPRDYAERIAMRIPSLAPTLQEAAGLYASLRYGPPLPPTEKKRLLAQLAACIRRLPSRRLF